mgnify:FL=1
MINKPIFVSLGDPSGIGPEVFLKAIKNPKIAQELSRIVLVSSPKVIEQSIRTIRVEPKINLITDIKDAKHDSKIGRAHV